MRPVTLVDYDPSWPALFAEQHEELVALLGDRVDAIHHIGSTAIPGLAAKPKVDIDTVVRSDSLVPEVIELIQNTGTFNYHGDPYGDRRWTFTRGHIGGIRLYVCGPDNAAHLKRMLFRDWLRTHPEDAAAYEALKRRLAADSNGNFDTYTGGKGEFVAEIVRQAATRLTSPA